MLVRVRTCHKAIWVRIRGDTHPITPKTHKHIFFNVFQRLRAQEPLEKVPRDHTDPYASMRIHKDPMDASQVNFENTLSFSDRFWKMVSTNVKGQQNEFLDGNQNCSHFMAVQDGTQYQILVTLFWWFCVHLNFHELGSLGVVWLDVPDPTSVLGGSVSSEGSFALKMPFWKTLMMEFFDFLWTCQILMILEVRRRCHARGYPHPPPLRAQERIMSWGWDPHLDTRGLMDRWAEIWETQCWNLNTQGEELR